ncbi:unnamed protein product [Pleuronectes platessa]|uniref:Prolactin-releasing peptide n=1 Tax=Pleuronectes platessa TaxID=8262 RepID=A0A9N7Y2Q9_PLEPL|nr:unnamed protein product [Pleuronectes platessa]
MSTSVQWNKDHEGPEAIRRCHSKITSDRSQIHNIVLPVQGFNWEPLHRFLLGDQEEDIPEGISHSVMGLRAVLCVVLLLLSPALSESNGDSSIVIRNPDIDASWYTGRGIRPVGRFGRRATRRNEHRVTARVYKLKTDRDGRIWIHQ